MSSQARPAASKSHETLWLVGLVGVACVAVGGLGLQLYKDLSRPPTAAPAPPPSRLLRASHADFFTGDLKRLQPHLDMTVGYVHLEYAPPDRFVNVEAQVWQDGKPLRSGPASSFRFRGGPSEASVSLTPATGPDGKLQFRVSAAVTGPVGYSAGITTLDAPATRGLQSHIKSLRDPVEIPDGPSVPVWAYLLYKRTGGMFRREDLEVGTFDEVVRAVEWAVVLKIGWKEPDDR